MSSRSLPNDFKQNDYFKRAMSNNQSTISKETISDGYASHLYSSSFNSSNVKVTSPLTQLPWLTYQVSTDSSGKMSNTSWMTRRWSTLSLIARRQKIRKTIKKSWKNRQKRRTFPPSQNLLSKDLDNFAQQPHRQSLQEILTQFDEQNNTTTSSSSSLLSKRLGTLLKKKGKRPLRKKKRSSSLFITSHVDQNNSCMFFQPPATISSKSSTPLTPVKFPTPPKRFSAYYIDLEGNMGRTDYRKPRNKQVGLVIQKLKGHFKSKEESYASYYHQHLIIHLTLFLLGFLFFPCWWIGTILYVVKKKNFMLLKRRQQQHFNEFDLISIHTFGYLNSIFSCLSFIFIALIIILLIHL